MWRGWAMRLWFVCWGWVGRMGFTESIEISCVGEQDLMNGFSNYGQEFVQNLNNQWPYLQARNYNDWDSVHQAFPHLKSINTPLDLASESQATGVVIRSGNDDNVHKAIKYGIWTTTLKNKGKLEQLWERKEKDGVNTYLFFSAVKSGMFEGVARLKSGYHEETFPFWWGNQELKFKGYFELEWVFIKDVNNRHFSGLINNQREEVIKSKDCDTLDSKTTVRMLSIFQKRKLKRSIFTDFAYMDERESQYIRKLYEVNLYQPAPAYSNFDLSQYSLVGHPLNLMNNVSPSNPLNSIISIPPTLMRPPTSDPTPTNSASKTKKQDN